MVNNKLIRIFNTDPSTLKYCVINNTTLIVYPGGKVIPPISNSIAFASFRLPF
jgi:hypothetical protein